MQSHFWIGAGSKSDRNKHDGTRATGFGRQKEEVMKEKMGAGARSIDITA